MGALVGAFHIHELSLHIGTSSHLPPSSRVVLGGLPSWTREGCPWPRVDFGAASAPATGLGDKTSVSSAFWGARGSGHRAKDALGV